MAESPFESGYIGGSEAEFAAPLDEVDPPGIFLHLLFYDGGCPVGGVVVYHKNVEGMRLA